MNINNSSLVILLVMLSGCSGSSSKLNLNDVSISCPSGYIAIPGNTTLGVSEFCVMQYEAKDDGVGRPISKAENAPWTPNQTDSKIACKSLGEEYDLISNPEWMTIARNIEAQDINWSNGTVGDGCIFRGNNGIDDACGYNGGSALFGTVRDSKSKHILSNGNEIWDIAGNVAEWADWTLGGSLVSGPTDCLASELELPNVAGGAGCALTDADYLPANPAGEVAAGYNSDYGLGTFYGDTGGATLRGGDYGYGVGAGVFGLAFYYDSMVADGQVGFRCVYRPVQKI